MRAAPAQAARGAIVNIASTRALQSEPDTEAYAASKGGLVALTHALAMSLGPAVRVNCISPGWIAHQPVRKKDHAQHPVGRVGRAEDVAEMVAYLLSDAAGFVTGQNFVIDGGMTKKMIYVLADQDRRETEQHAHAHHVGRGGEEDARGGRRIEAEALQRQRHHRAGDAARHAGADHGEEHDEGEHPGLRLTAARSR